MWSSYSETFENMTSAINETILFCLNFHKHIFTKGWEQTSLLNHCLRTQRRPHVRPRAMLRAVFSFTNNNPQWINNTSSEENDTSSDLRIMNNIILTVWNTQRTTTYICSIFRKSVCIRVLLIFWDRASFVFPLFPRKGGQNSENLWVTFMRDFLKMVCIFFAYWITAERYCCLTHKRCNN